MQSFLVEQIFNELMHQERLNIDFIEILKHSPELLPFFMHLNLPNEAMRFFNKANAYRGRLAYVKERLGVQTAFSLISLLSRIPEFREAVTAQRSPRIFSSNVTAFGEQKIALEMAMNKIDFHYGLHFDGVMLAIETQNEQMLAYFLNPIFRYPKWKFPKLFEKLVLIQTPNQNLIKILLEHLAQFCNLELRKDTNLTFYKNLLHTADDYLNFLEHLKNPILFIRLSGGGGALMHQMGTIDLFQRLLNLKSVAPHESVLLKMLEEIPLSTEVLKSLLDKQTPTFDLYNYICEQPERIEYEPLFQGMLKKMGFIFKEDGQLIFAHPHLQHYIYEPINQAVAEILDALNETSLSYKDKLHCMVHIQSVILSPRASRVAQIEKAQLMIKSIQNKVADNDDKDLASILRVLCKILRFLGFFKPKAIKLTQDFLAHMSTIGETTPPNENRPSLR